MRRSPNHESINSTPISRELFAITTTDLSYYRPTFSYSSDDPYFVKIIFEKSGPNGEDIIWEAPRQILANGLTDKAGYNIKSSVSAQPCDEPNFTQIDLMSETFQRFSFIVRTPELEVFLTATEDRVPAGKESSYHLPALNATLEQLESLGYSSANQVQM